MSFSKARSGHYRATKFFSTIYLVSMFSIYGLCWSIDISHVKTCQASIIVIHHLRSYNREGKTDFNTTQGGGGKMGEGTGGAGGGSAMTIG